MITFFKEYKGIKSIGHFCEIGVQDYDADDNETGTVS